MSLLEQIVRPRIFVLSPSGADSFDWVSDGWWFNQPDLRECADKCIELGDTVDECCYLLEQVGGFEVLRDCTPELIALVQTVNTEI